MSITTVGEIGEVELIGCFGDASTVVDAARVSFGRSSGEGALTEGDRRLLGYLWRNKHWSPFRHVLIRWRIRAPEFVMRHLWKHIVGIECTSAVATKDSAWNEISGRYVVVKRFHTPVTWRSQHPERKQGSGEALDPEPQAAAREIYQRSLAAAVEGYEALLATGVAKEQARMLLPLSQMTEVVWTSSVQALHNLFDLRTHPHAQYETREIVRCMQQAFADAQPELASVMG